MLTRTDPFLLKISYRVFYVVIDVTIVRVLNLFGIKKEDISWKHTEIYLITTTLLFIVLALGMQWEPQIGWFILVIGNLRILQILSLNLMTILFDFSFSHSSQKKTYEQRARWHFIALGFSFLDTVLIFSMHYYFLSQHFQVLSQESIKFLDCFYYAVMTMTTIGFGDIHPVDSYGKILSIYQAVLAIFFLIFAVSGAISRLHQK